MDSFLATCLSTYAGTLFLIPFAALTLKNEGWPDIHLNGWVAIVYLGAFASAVSYFLYNKALETLTASQVGNFVNLDPVIGVIIALIFLHERISALQIVGALMVLAGIWLTSTKNKEA